MGITLTDLLSDPQIVRVLSLDGRSRAWMEDFERLQSGDRSLTRKSVGEHSIKSMQRLSLIGCNISDEALEAYKKDRPAVRVYHSKPLPRRAIPGTLPGRDL